MELLTDAFETIGLGIAAFLLILLYLLFSGVFGPFGKRGDDHDPPMYGR